MSLFDIFKRKKTDTNVTTDTLEDTSKKNEDVKKSSVMVARNLKGIELEKQGKIEDAIKLYEENLNDEFDGNHPYDRLAIIYRKKKLYNEEKRVLKKAITVFENISSKRQDRDSKLDKFKDRLSKLNDKFL